ncbi:18298_t:CDS:1, partial [Racocetra fulgida]
NINWLSSDLDKLTDTESSCSFSLFVKENETDYKIKDNKQSNNSKNKIKQCVITEIKDGKLKHCLNKTYRQIKQIIRM